MKEKVDMNLAMLIVYNTLGIGKENAVSRRQIVESTGYPDRLIRECIERLREEEPILSATDGSGYYIATEDAQGVTEAVEWVTGQNRRAEIYTEVMQRRTEAYKQSTADGDGT